MNEGNIRTAPADSPLMVSIRCIAYNQEKYISAALDGFVMQQTTFRYEAVVHDDASTDGTAAVILDYARRYPGIIKPIIETENQYSKHDGSLDRIMDAACTGKYVAYCEGDDCWTDPLKLQKQVDFLEAHPDYSLSHTDIDYAFADGRHTIRRIHHHQRNYNQAGRLFPADVMPQLILSGRYSVQTLSVCARRDMVCRVHNDCPELHTDAFKMGDTPLWIELSQMGKFHFLKQSTAIYHVTQESATHSKNFSNVISFYVSCLHMVDFFGNRYSMPRDFVNSIKNEYVSQLLCATLINKAEYRAEIGRRVIQDMPLDTSNRALLTAAEWPTAARRVLLIAIRAIAILRRRAGYCYAKWLGYPVQTTSQPKKQIS